MIHDFKRDEIAGLGRVEDVPCRWRRDAAERGGLFGLRQHLLRDTGDPGCRRVLFKMTVLPAAADQRLIRIDLDVADLARRPEDAGKNLSVQDDAAAYPGPQRDHNDVFMPFAAALPHLAERGDIGVIADTDLFDAGQLLQLLRHIDDAPAEVHRTVDDGVMNHRARNIDPDAFQFVRADLPVREILLHRLRDVAEDIRAVLLLPGRNFMPVNQLSVRPEKSDLHRRSPEIHAKCIRFHFNFPPSPASSEAFSRQRPDRAVRHLPIVSSYSTSKRCAPSSRIFPKMQPLSCCSSLRSIVFSLSSSSLRRSRRSSSRLYLS